MPETLRVRLQLKAKSPVAFGARRGTTSSFVDTLDYVPGTALRGAAAARYLRELGEPEDPKFREIFLSGGIKFVNLYPVDEADVSYVLPASAYSCKAHREAHGVKDTLAPAAAIHVSKGPIKNELLDSILDCTECKHAAHGISGFYETYPGEPRYALVEAHKRQLMHVGINRQTQTAEKGVLFAHEVLSEARRSERKDFKSQLFSGEMIVSEQKVEFLMNKLLAKGNSLRLGESRTRGLGHMTVEKCEIVVADTEEAVSRRIGELNRKLGDFMPNAAEQSFVSLTCQSDVLLMDVFMRPKSAPDGTDIQRALSDDYRGVLAPESLRMVYANTGARLVQSWNVASGYPKSDNIAITMGSVFLFQVTGGRAQDLAAPLASLQERGIGSRLSEGFGRLTVCDPFHLEVKGRWRVS